MSSMLSLLLVVVVVVVAAASPAAPLHATTRRLNSTAVVVGVVKGPETAKAGDTVQYRVLIGRHDDATTASVVDIRESTCCQDVAGRCQTWLGREHDVVCHGVRATVDYRVTVVARAQRRDSHHVVHDVLVPINMKAGHIEGVQEDDVAVDEASWSQFRSKALATLVKKEVGRTAAAPKERLQLLEPIVAAADDGAMPVWAWVAIALGIVAAVAVVVLLLLAARRWRRKSLADDLMMPSMEYLPL